MRDQKSAPPAGGKGRRKREGLDAAAKRVTILLAEGAARDLEWMLSYYKEYYVEPSATALVSKCIELFRDAARDDASVAAEWAPGRRAGGTGLEKRSMIFTKGTLDAALALKEAFGREGAGASMSEVASACIAWRASGFWEEAESKGRRSGED